MQSFSIKKDTIPLPYDGKLRKSIYPQSAAHKSKLYNKLWGKHYRHLYSTPIEVDEKHLDNLYGGLVSIEQVAKYQGILMHGKDNKTYLLRPVDGSATFLRSTFFKKIYDKEDYKETYLNEFIEDAYTITNPFAFKIADNLAGKIGLDAYNPQVYYIAADSLVTSSGDTINVGGCMTAIYQLDDLSLQKTTLNTTQLLSKLEESKSNKVNQQEYIRERLFNMLVGDWNKPPENWIWEEEINGSGLEYSPLIIDRVCSFPRVDGMLFKGILGMFGLACITNYDYELSDLKKFNQLTLPLDIAVTSISNEEVWIKQANYIKQQLTDEIIEKAFKLFPPEVQGIETELIKRKLKTRRNNLDKTAERYYNLLQETAIVTGTNNEDRIIVDRLGKKELDVNIFDRDNKLVFNKQFDKRTKEIWIYGLNGNDIMEQRGASGNKSTSITLIGGHGDDRYNIVAGKKTKIYEYKDEIQNFDSIASAKLTLTTVDSVLNYDYTKLKYQNFSVTPWGIYDSDLGLYLGVYATWTMYGFKRVPYTYRHRIGYNYLNGFMYIGSFPSFDERKTFILEAYLGTTKNFTNFFGYGNNTEGFKNEERKYNRVKISKYTITPSYYYNFHKDQRIYAKGALEIFKMHETTDRYINMLYTPDDPIFDTKYYANLTFNYDLKKRWKHYLSALDFTATGGFTVNILNPDILFPYAEGRLAFNIKLSDRITWATEVKGKALFSNQYEFFQSASTVLRGTRDNRYIGRQTLYQHTDIRFDLGNLDNPFMPLKYGIFSGFDYGRVWYPGEKSDKWHTSFGGGFWLTLFKQYTGKFSYFGSHDGSRFSLGLGMGF